MYREVRREEEKLSQRKLWPLWIFSSRQIASPTISASTTSTNLSTYGSNSFGSNVLLTNNRSKKMVQNLREVLPEIQPLRGDKHVIEITDQKEETAEEPKKSRSSLSQILTAISVSLVSACVGFISAYTSPAASSLKTDIGITTTEMSWIASLMPLSALIGGLIGGQLIEFIGRKKTLIVTNTLFMAAWLLTAIAKDVWYLYVARSVAGFSVGIASLVLPVYLGETLQPEVRGSLGLLPTAFGNTGILLCFVAGSYVRFHILAFIGLALTLPFCALVFIIPETPRWYISKRKEEDAKKALKWLRRKEANTEGEYEDLKASQFESEKSSNCNIRVYLSRQNIKVIAISLGLMFFQQFSGINALIFYTTDIFEMAGSSIPKDTCTIIVGLVNFVSTFLATLVIDRLGRKVLLYISSCVMVVTLVILSAYFFVKKNTDISVEGYGWIPLASLVIYVLGFSLGFGPIPWLMMGEILPSKIRGSAASLATAFNWACTFIVTKAFIDIMKWLGFCATFSIFASICTLSIIFTFFCVPETSGRSLEDIERKLAGKKVRRMSSLANLKPMPSTF